MTAISDDMTDPALEQRSAPPKALPWTRLFYWSVRRELWENPAVYVAPLLAAAAVLLGVLIGMLHPPHMTRTTHVGGVIQQTPIIIPIVAPYVIALVAIGLTGLVVGAFYCLGALHNERRDRSVLFWKSLPVSDLMTVLSKAAIPMAVLPLVTFAVVVATHLIMLMLGTATFLANGQDAAVLWNQVPVLKMWALLLYGLVALALWQAPVWAWLLMVSAWARRTPFLWGVGAPLAACLVDRLAFGSSDGWTLLLYRLSGGMKEAFVDAPRGQGFPLPEIDPTKFLLTPGLWVGLGFAAIFIAVAVWMRRRREPI